MEHRCDRQLRFSLLQASLSKHCSLIVLIGTSLGFLAASSDYFALAQTSRKAREPVLETNTPICYLQATDGKVLDLERLCKASQPSAVVISSLNYKSNFLLGRVMNRSRDSVHSVEIVYQILNEDGTLEQQSIKPAPSALTPQQLGAFEIIIPAGAKVKSISVIWQN